LIDEVRQGQALVLVLLGYGYDKAEIGFCQFIESFLISLLDTDGEFDLFFGTDQLYFPYLLQVLLQALRFTIRYTLRDLQLTHAHRQRSFKGFLGVRLFAFNSSASCRPFSRPSAGSLDWLKSHLSAEAPASPILGKFKSVLVLVKNVFLGLFLYHLVVN